MLARLPVHERNKGDEDPVLGAEEVQSPVEQRHLDIGVHGRAAGVVDAFEVPRRRADHVMGIMDRHPASHEVLDAIDHSPPFSRLEAVLYRQQGTAGAYRNLDMAVALQCIRLRAGFQISIWRGSGQNCRGKFCLLTASSLSRYVRVSAPRYCGKHRSAEQQA